MLKRFQAAGALLALAVAACSGGNSSSTAMPSTLANGRAVKPATARIAVPAASKSSRIKTMATGTNLLADPGFESDSFSAWQQCGNVNATITSARAHGGRYSDLNGSTAKPEVNGYAGVCQQVTIPSNGTLSFWVYEGTNDTIAYADQEADLLDAAGNTIATLYSEAKTTSGWVQKTFNVSAYAGQTVWLFFGVYGNGWTGGYIYQYVDDVFLGANGATPTPAPSATPTVAPSATPTVAPTATPAYPCNNQGFLNDQSAFAAGTIAADQFVQVCGKVTSVLPSKTTASGLHGYFYVQMPSGYNIEIVSNLDAMAQASTNRPPSTWPWVATGDYVYVQGRYYYDNASSQGIDWTEDDTSSSWPHLGDVVVCAANAANCNFYW